MASFELGSATAKGGFANEREICRKFNDWREDNEARLWLKIMGYDVRMIENVTAIHIPTRLKREIVSQLGFKDSYEELMRFKKADAQLRIFIKIGNILRVEV